MATRFDAIVVGAGQAGPPLAGRLTAAGQSVAVIERKLVGGTCVNYGCIPTKTLVASAHTAHSARRGAEYGINTSDVTVDMAAVKARKDRVMLDDRHGVESWLEGMAGCTLIRGHARFEGAHTIRVNDQVLEADRIFLNVGGRAIVPDIPGLSDVDYLTNVGILDLDELPEHLVIIGASYIALEFAQMYRRFGARVSVVERGPRVTPREDEDVSEAIQQILEAEGIDVHVGATGMRIVKHANDSGFDLHPREGAEPISGSHLLVATGRQPNTDDLGLDVAGVETDARGYVTVDDQLRTNVEGVWAMGDCNGKGAFTHTSYNDFEIVAGNLLDDDPRRVSDRVPTYALYIDPPLGRAGMSTAEVRASGRKALVGKLPMTKVGRAVEKGETQGFMKVLVDADTHEILGAAILGVGGDEVVQDILDVMTAKLPYTAISRTMHIHPTVSELVPTLLQELTPLA
ncbi:MAG: pyridine nucleotide-disulfide oxidoreductase dimerization region [Mycobacterium sp.]|nr:pyridine nucleotide-disulfide oxidoreductase dimerization region [Mycobacterium sp.]